MLLSPEAVAFIKRISGKLIYGTIILGAMFGSLDDPLPSNLRVIAILVVSLYGVSLANNYAMSIERDMKSGRSTPLWDQWGILLMPGWLMASAIVPVFVFGLAATGLIAQQTAATATRNCLVLILLLAGFVSRRISGGSLAKSLVSAGLVATLGYVVVRLKLWIKYMPGLG